MIAGLKDIALRHSPAAVRHVWSHHKARQRPSHGDLPRVFEDIYQNGLWGTGGWGSGEVYDSGPGSAGAAAGDFVRVVNDLIESEGLISVVDIGCGDFRVGSRIARPGLDYTGVDIFPGLIEQNTQRHGRAGLRFVCADATKGALPKADLCIIREVLQHLSNDDIAAILGQLGKFRFAVIAEHHPAPGFLWKANVDKAAGSDTRVFFDSAVVPGEAPFSLANVTVAARSPSTFCRIRPGEEIVTYLVKLP